MNSQERIEQASKAYYEGNPVMSDDEFDTLVDQAKNLDSFEESVGFGYSPTGRKVELSSPMLSLDKVHSDDELVAWIRGIQREFPSAEFVVDPKWDGLPIQATFENGKLVLAATRGNGFIGENVTELAQHIEEVMGDRRAARFTGIVNGEVVITNKQFEQLNSDTDNAYTLPRSAAAGLLRRLSDQKESAAYLSFRLHEHGLPDDVTHPTGDVEKIVSQAMQMGETDTRISYGAGIDGAVIKVSDPNIREELGTSRTSPRWAVALKFEARSRETTLKDIRWTVGRSGRLIPSAYFEPVNFDNSTEFATLHNTEWMESLNLHAGDTVQILSRGDVIPYFNGVIAQGDGEPFTTPSECPLCQGQVKRDGVHLLCVDNCNIEAKLIHFFRAFDTKGIGPGIISKLFDSELLPSTKTNIVDLIPDVLNLDASKIAELDGAGESVAATYGSEVLRIAETGTVTEWLVSLGIPSLGWSTSEALADNFGTIPMITQTLFEAPEKVMQLNGFGETSVDTLVGHIHDMYKLDSLLTDLGIEPAQPEKAEVQHDERWSGKNIVLTGTLPNGMSRGEAADWFSFRGANIQGGVTGKTDILVAGEKAGSKLAKAEGLGIQIINGAEFASIVGEQA